MGVLCRCGSCDAAFEVAAKYAGRKIKCPKCGGAIEVTAGDREAGDRAARVEAPAPFAGRRWPRRGTRAAVAAAAVILAAVAAHLAWSAWRPAREPSSEAAVEQLPAPGNATDPAPGPKQDEKSAIRSPSFLTAAQARANLSGWSQDVDAARQQAAAEGKSLAIVFLGSERFSTRWLQEVLGRPEFSEALGGRYVFALIDFPREREARARVRDPERNLAVRRHYQVRRLPRMVLADARGLPFGLIDYAEGGMETFLKRLERAEANRAERDRLFRDIESAAGEGKLSAIEKALALLGELDLVPQYKAVLQDWLALVQKHDPSNEHGAHEAVFHAVWMIALMEVQLDKPNRQEIDRRIAELDEWMRTHRFKNPDRAASLHYYAAGALSVSGQLDAALRRAEAGLACRPRNPVLREQLAMAVAAIRGVGAGTGFAVAPGGLVLTNFHVVQGARTIKVRLSGRGDVFSAQVVAQDSRQDISLLKVELPPGLELAPIPLAETPARRGARVLAIGFPPANSWSDAALKLTQGIISATPDENPEGMFVLDCRINPGNSGGPLCDASGNAVGMVTAKSYGGIGVDSYGMALPSETLRQFLAKNLPPGQTLAPPRKAERPLDWEEVAPQVSPSVMMVLRGQ